MPRVDQRISEYLLVEKIGGGAFGEVWKARHHVWADQLVAIKIPTDPGYVRNLQREGKALHGLVHPNIVRAIGFDPFADPPYLTMELVPGSSLRPIIAAKTLTPPQVVAMLRQVLAGVGFAHSRGLIHRDLKPENVLVHERAMADGFGVDGVVKIADFGLGRATLDTEKLAAGSIAYSTSLAGDAGRELAGTLDYMAPEQRSGAAVDKRADLYACGVLLYEMLTGEKPAGTDVPSDVNPKCPRSLDDVFRRSYARLEKRFATAEQFRVALDAAMPAGHAAPPQPALPPVRRVTVDRMTGATCPQCHKPVEATDQFCIHCGLQLSAVVKRCGRCGAYPDASDQFCMFCGERLSAA